MKDIKREIEREIVKVDDGIKRRQKEIDDLRDRKRTLGRALRPLAQSNEKGKIGEKGAGFAS